MVTASVPVKARVPNIIDIGFLQVNMVCIDTEFFVVRVARLKPWVDIQGISTSHNCHSMGCAGSKPRPGRILRSLDLNCPYPALITLPFHIKHIPFANNSDFIQCFPDNFGKMDPFTPPPPKKKKKKKIQSKFKIQK